MQLMPNLRNWCSKQKDKLSSLLKKEDNLVRPNHMLWAQILDNKDVSWAAPNSNSVNTCTTCTYYHVRKVEEADLKDEEEQPLYTKPPEVVGACLYLMPKYVIEGISPKHSCSKYRNKDDQFIDDMINAKLQEIQARILGE